MAKREALSKYGALLVLYDAAIDAPVSEARAHELVDRAIASVGKY